MKIEFLANGSCDCPLIHIYDFSSSEAWRLRQTLGQLLNGRDESISLDELTEAETANACHVIAQVGRRDEGVLVARADRNSFVWILTPTSWDRVVGLIDPFCSSGKSGFQWLDEIWYFHYVNPIYDEFAVRIKDEEVRRVFGLD